MNKKELEGVVFDADGTLFDTERLGYWAWEEAGRQMGCPQAADCYPEVVGRGRGDVLALLPRLLGPDFPHEPFMELRSRLATERMEREGVPLKPGVREILEFLTARRVPAALATSTNRERTQRRMEMTGLRPCFSAVVTGDQVAHSKPDPEIYQLACRALGTTPSRTLAIEDSRNGILSAHAAGMPVVMVPDLIPPTPELERLLFRRCASLLEVRELLDRLLTVKTTRETRGLNKP